MQKTILAPISTAEWEVMRVVWANGSVTSRDVIDVLMDKMDWTESTIKTLIGRLVEKEALTTVKDGRRFIYSANITEKDTVNDYSADILDRVCDKKNGLVIQHLIQDATLSLSDIENIVSLLEEKAKSAPEVIPCNCSPGQCDCHRIS